MNLAFEDGRPVPVTWPADDNGEPEPVVDRLDGQEVLRWLIDWLVADQRTAADIGRRAALLAYLMKAPGAPATQRDLARLLEISPAMVNKLLAAFPRDFRRIRALR